MCSDKIWRIGCLSVILFACQLRQSPALKLSKDTAVPFLSVSATRALLNSWGSDGIHLATVLEHYARSSDSLKLKAACFLLKNVGDHYFVDVPHVYDSLLAKQSRSPLSGDLLNKALDSISREHSNTVLSYIPDYKAVTAEMLIENIDYAFLAWQLPWARKLSFDDFCTYILPYKVGVEKPVRWRKKCYDQLRPIIDSLPANASRQSACAAINNGLAWFKFQWPFRYPTVMDFNQLEAVKMGNCEDATTLTLYAMRAAGVPATFDFTTQWANRSYGHSWNTVLYENGNFVSFQGTESNPGESKIEYDPKEDWTFSRAKIFRRTFTKSGSNAALFQISRDQIPAVFHDEFYIDVTASIVPTSNIDIPLLHSGWTTDPEFGYLCVFNNENWVPVSWGFVNRGVASFKNVGQNSLYIVACYNNGHLEYASLPFSIDAKGALQSYKAGLPGADTLLLQRKYPYNNSNLVKEHDLYELQYWDNGWRTLDTVTARSNYVAFSHLPVKALYIMHDLTRGKQERPFSIEQKEQRFW